jgi:transcription initiation factor TFIIB
VFAAIRQANVPYSLDEVGKMSRSTLGDVRSSYRYIKRELGLEIHPPEAEPFVGRFSKELSLSEATENQAYDLLQREANQSKLSGKSPAGLAAAAIYAASRLTEEKIAQLTLAEIASVSAVTIRKRYQELLEIADGQ